MNYSRTIPAILSAVIALSSIALSPLTSPQIALALTADKVKTVAKEITVRIQGPKGGSGVILEKRGSTYYILTNWHVVDKAGDYEVVTPDGQAHSVYYSLVRRVPGMDLAVVPFSSTQSYPLAQLANSSATKGNKAYVAGWPTSGGSLRQPIFIATEGQLTGRQTPWNGYTLVYDNLVRAGMSGGPVLDSAGRVVAINGIVRLEDNSDKIVAAGIEINTFMKWRSTVSLPAVPASPTAGNQKNPVNNSPRNPASTRSFTATNTLKGNSEVISSLALASAYFATGNSDGTISVWNFPSGELKTTLQGHAEAVNAVAMSADGKVLASGSDDKTVKIWNLETGAVLRTLSGHSGAVSSVAFSPDGLFVASGSWDKKIKIWNAKTGELLRTLTGHSALVNAVAIAPDSKTLASGSKDGSIRFWNLATGQAIRTINGKNLSVLSLAFTPDGKSLAAGNSNGTIGLWNAGNGQLIRRLSGHTDGVWSVAISRDGSMLVSGSWDKSVRLWDVRSGDLRGSLSGHSGYVSAVAISGDGKTIVSAGWLGEIKIWKRGS
ncbi:trypsin-like peptidase domain-containing protein [Microcoleus sp. LEGE 07076]|uniref:WD40 domain-containing protein n=1 Tax=Microcoleus sp. LEGE 07076 TaxID=915322 RepID=UPI00187F66BF|nr:trypsin-like peptidase domain-containing protein [Microcoleus sp. LEGE 07076]MBE9186323.1 trypsin-like peptidase domain-containing protein [Microcoleus sp. LEGE 07076]